MIRFYLILLMALCMVTITLAQNSNYTYGAVPIEQLKMDRYENDTTANAVIVYEKGHASIEKADYGQIRLIYTYKARVKILKKEAFDKATYEIPLYKSGKKKKRLKYVKAIATNLGEAPVGLNKKDIYTENYSENWDVVKFTVPNVSEGTVFDVEYQVSSPFIWNFQEWEFQGDIPKLYSEYYTSIPGNYLYNIKLIGPLKLDEHTGEIKKKCLTVGRGGSADCEINTYIMKDIPAFVAEEYMTSEENYISKIEFELRESQDFTGRKYKYTKSWKDADKELRTGDDIGKQAQRAKNFKKLIPEDIMAISNTTDKAKAIYSYLQKRMTWDGKLGIFRTIDVKKAFEARAGNAAELNLILLNMLNAAGIDANFMLVSTRKNGIATRLYPVITEFNYVVVKLDAGEKSYLLDITSKNVPFGRLPFRALNSYGRVIDFKKGSYWYDIKAGQLSLNTNYTEYRIDAEGKVTVNMLDTNTGYFAINKRAKLLKTAEDDYLEAVENNLNKVSDAEITTYKVSNKDDINTKLNEQFSIDFQENFEDDFIYMYPFIYNKHSENPFKLDSRNYPVNFGYTFGYNHKISIKIDPSYEITEIPRERDITIGKNYATLSLKSYTSANEISINMVFTINKSIFMPEEYRELKNLFSELVAIQNNMPVVLKKK